VNNFPTMPRADAGLPVPCTRLLATSIPVPRWMEHRQPRINGDTRRRKRRLRDKLAKLDAILYAPAIRAAAAELKRRVIDKIEREIFANSRLGQSQKEQA
jgi:hypothetical protein